MDIAAFRAALPEFADTAVYPDSLVLIWSNVATSFVNEARWAEVYDTGIYLVTAHHLVLGERDSLTAQVGGTPGQVTGPLSAKAVDKVSASYDTGAAVIDGGGFWNLTTYGIRYLSLARIFGAGGLQI